MSISLADFFITPFDPLAKASTKVSVQKIILELEMLKVLIEFHHISNMKDIEKARESFEKMYG